MKKNKPRQVIENVPVVDIADDGKAVGKSGDEVIFLSHAVPGDVVDVQIIRRRKKYAEGQVIRFEKYSEWRVTPLCREFPLCGGCKWQDLSYERQLFYKQKNVSDCLTRIGKLEIPAIRPIIPADATFYYRNKLEFSFSCNRWLTDEEIKSGCEASNRHALGFHLPSKFDKVLDIRQCFLQADPSNDIRSAIREFSAKEGMPYFNLRACEGFLRTLVIRTSSSGEVMVIVTFYRDDTALRKKLLDFIRTSFAGITSLMYVINPKPNDSIADLEVRLYHGREFITEEMEGLKFRIGPKSFFQTNSQQAGRLYREVRELSGLTGTETVYDLYTGTGTIANFLAAQAGKVIGVECVPEAIEDAKQNAALNGIGNAFFLAGDTKDVFNPDFIRQHGNPDTVILDPPRAGVHSKVIDALLFAQPQRIVYVSCNPASQARDLSFLQEAYDVRAVQPVDMFPHTHHVENIVMMEKRKTEKSFIEAL
ncbi:MAG: 23S rRNA (uracil(1939)-C(5))-methyltransferase RlmD [Bacteroidales bacterium]|jgi:23S rRNA (uracil1939-C5)-methyltransferase|nr:23S rRNA (uracil(1939)-C(5))-methyltransferase RlmD [Bacteroidales bacterium]